MEAEYGDEPSQLHYVFIFAGLWVWVWVVMATKKRLSLYICGKRGRTGNRLKRPGTRLKKRKRSGKEAEKN